MDQESSGTTVTATPPFGADKDPEWDMTIQRHLLERRMPKKDGELPKVLYHYTTGDGLAGILRTRRLWATDVRYLNDTAEFQHGIGLVSAELDDLKKKSRTDQALITEWERALRMSANVRLYVVAFSTDSDSLSQWRAYARPFGFALGLDMPHVLAISDAPPDTVLVYPCIYETAAQEDAVTYGIRYLSDEYGRRQQATPGSPNLVTEFGAHFLAFVLSTAASFKHPAFKDEHEWRLVVRLLVPTKPALVRRARPGARMLVPYLELPIATAADPMSVFRIVIGPTPDYGLAHDGLSALCEHTKTDVRDIVNSKVPFRDWQ